MAATFFLFFLSTVASKIFCCTCPAVFVFKLIEKERNKNRQAKQERERKKERKEEKRTLMTLHCAV